MPASNATIRIADLLDRLGRYLRSREHAGDLNPVQWEALRYLAQANRYSVNPSALTEFLGSTKGTVSQTLIVLESKGLISRDADPGDRRQLRLGRSEEHTSELPPITRSSYAVLCLKNKTTIN